MYSFYLGGTLLPITPAKMTVKIKGSNKTLALANEGELNILRFPSLTEISFEALLPMLGQYSFAGAYKSPSLYISLLEKLMLDRKPFQFIVSRVSPQGKLLYDTNMKVSLEEYTITEDATKGLDVVVAITLKQYIHYTTKTVTVVQSEKKQNNTITEETSRAPGKAPADKTYTVVKGDCLWNIAKKYYGNGAQYTKIYNANKDKIANPNLIYQGQVLTIP